MKKSIRTKKMKEEGVVGERIKDGWMDRASEWVRKEQHGQWGVELFMWNSSLSIVDTLWPVSYTHTRSHKIVHGEQVGTHPHICSQKTGDRKQHWALLPNKYKNSRFFCAFYHLMIQTTSLNNLASSIRTHQMFSQLDLSVQTAQRSS